MNSKSMVELRHTEANGTTSIDTLTGLTMKTTENCVVHKSLKRHRT